MAALRGLRQAPSLDSFLAIGRDELEKSGWTLQQTHWMAVLDELEDARSRLFPGLSAASGHATRLNGVVDARTHAADMLYTRALTHYFAVYQTCVSLIPLPLSRWRSWYAGLTAMMTHLVEVGDKDSTNTATPAATSEETRTRQHQQRCQTMLMEYEKLYLVHFWGTRYAVELRLTQLLQHGLHNHTSGDDTRDERAVSERGADDDAEQQPSCVVVDPNTTRMMRTAGSSRRSTVDGEDDAAPTAPAMDAVSQFTRRHFALLHGFNTLAYDAQHLFDQYGVIGYTERQLLGQLLMGKANSQPEAGEEEDMHDDDIHGSTATAVLRDHDHDNYNDSDNGDVDNNDKRHHISTKQEDEEVDEMAVEAVMRQTFRRDMAVPSSALLSNALAEEYALFEVDEKKGREVQRLAESAKQSAWFRAAEALYQHTHTTHTRDAHDCDSSCATRTDMALDGAATIRRDALLDGVARSLAQPSSSQPSSSAARMTRTAVALAHHRLIDLEDFPGILNPSRMEYILLLLHRWLEQYMARAHRWSVQDDYVDDDDADLWRFVLERHEVLLCWGLQSCHAIAEQHQRQQQQREMNRDCRMDPAHGHGGASDTVDQGACASCSAGQQHGCASSCLHSNSRLDKNGAHVDSMTVPRHHDCAAESSRCNTTHPAAPSLAVHVLRRQVEVVRTIAFSLLHAGQLYLSGLMRSRASAAKTAVRAAASRRALKHWINHRLIDAYARALLNDLDDVLHDAYANDKGDDEENDKEDESAAEAEVSRVLLELESRLKLVVSDAMMLGPGGRSARVCLQTRHRLVPMVSRILDALAAAASSSTSSSSSSGWARQGEHTLGVLAQLAVRMMHRLERTHTMCAISQLPMTHPTTPPPPSTVSLSDAAAQSSLPPTSTRHISRSHSDCPSEAVVTRAQDTMLSALHAKDSSGVISATHDPSPALARNAPESPQSSLLTMHNSRHPLPHPTDTRTAPPPPTRLPDVESFDFALLMPALYAELLRRVPAALRASHPPTCSSSSMPCCTSPALEHDPAAHMIALVDTISDGWARCVSWEGVHDTTELSHDGSDDMDRAARSLTPAVGAYEKQHETEWGCGAVYHPRSAGRWRAGGPYGLYGAASRAQEEGRRGMRSRWMDGCCERRRAMRVVKESGRAGSVEGVGGQKRGRCQAGQEEEE